MTAVWKTQQVQDHIVGLPQLFTLKQSKASTLHTGHRAKTNKQNKNKKKIKKKKKHWVLGTFGHWD